MRRIEPQVWALARGFVGVALAALVTLASGRAQAQVLPLQHALIYPLLNPVSVAYSPNGKLVAVLGSGGARIYSVATGAEVMAPVTPSGSTLMFTPNSQKLVIVSYAAMDVVDVNSGTLLKTAVFPVTSSIAVAFSPDGSEFVVGSQNSAGGFLQIWNATTYKPVKTLLTAFSQVTGVAFSPDGKTLADSGWMGSTASIELWNRSTGKLTKTLQTSSEDAVNNLAFSPDSKTLADAANSAVDAGVVELWNVSTGKQTASLKTSATFKLESIAFSSDGRTLADSGSEMSSGALVRVAEVELWDVTKAALLSKLDTAANVDAFSVAFSPDGKTLADVGSYPGSIVEFWNVSTHMLKESINTATPFACSAVAYSPDGKTIAAGFGTVVGAATTYNVGLWNAATGLPIRSMVPAANNAVTSVAFSPDGTLLADSGVSINGSTNRSGVLEIWKVASGKLTASLKSACQTVSSVAFSPDGKVLADGGNSASAGLVELWDVETGKQISVLQIGVGSAIQSIAFSPDGKRVAVAGSNSTTWPNYGVLDLWDVSTGMKVKSLGTSAQTAVNSVAFSPDGKMLADAGYSNEQWGQIQLQQGVVELWDAATGDNMEDPAPGMLEAALWVAFSPDSKLLFASNGALLGFGIANDSFLLNDDDFGVTALAVSPQGRQLALARASGELVLVQNLLTGAVPLKSLTVSPALLAGGQSATATVTLASPAPAGGLLLNVTWSGLNLTAPGFVTVAGGATTASFPVVANANTTKMSGAIIVSDSIGAQSASLTVSPATLTSLTLSPTQVTGGTSSTGTVTLSSTAFVAVTIKLSSSSSYATLPTSVTIQAGQTSATFAVNTTKPSATQTATIKATAGSVSQTATLTIS
jgi:WD40 repeat protein